MSVSLLIEQHDGNNLLIPFSTQSEFEDSWHPFLLQLAKGNPIQPQLELLMELGTGIPIPISSLPEIIQTCEYIQMELPNADLPMTARAKMIPRLEAILATLRSIDPAQTSSIFWG